MPRYSVPPLFGKYSLGFSDGEWTTKQQHTNKKTKVAHLLVAVIFSPPIPCRWQGACTSMSAERRILKAKRGGIPPIQWTGFPRSLPVPLPSETPLHTSFWKTSCHLVDLLTYWQMIKNGGAHIFSSTWSGFHLHPAVLCFQLDCTALVAGVVTIHPSIQLSVRRSAHIKLIQIAEPLVIRIPKTILK